MKSDSLSRHAAREAMRVRIGPGLPRTPTEVAAPISRCDYTVPVDRDLVESFYWVEASFRLGLIPPEEVVAWASERVATLSGSGLVPLAVMSEPARRDDVATALRGIADAERLVWASDLHAGLTVARHIACRIVDGNLEPIDGARMIWWRVANWSSELRVVLNCFIGLASEWEDSSAHRAHYDELIRSAAADLLLEGDPQGGPR